MKAKGMYGLFIAAFMTMLLLPLLKIDLNGGAISKQENRVLASRPSLSLALEHPVGFVKGLDTWFMDNVGFREQLISLYKHLDALETEGPYTDGQYKMLIGKEGHRYFAHTNGILIEKFQGKPYLTDEQLTGMTEGLKWIKATLDARNLPFTFMLCVDKETVYPEFYPDSIIKGQGPDQIDIITSAIAATGIDTFNLKARLLSEKANYPVFDITGDAVDILSHYNEIGAFFAYQELMAHIHPSVTVSETLTLDDVNITYREKAGFPNIPNVRVTQPIGYQRTDATFFDGVPQEETRLSAAFVSEDASLPRLLVLCDSYYGIDSFVSQYMTQHFSQAVQLHWRNASKFTTYIERYQPDMIVFEVSERELRDFADTMLKLQANEVAL